MKRSGAQIISEFLERRGVRCIAGMPGGANLPLYDALSQSSIQHVLVRHEQAAGFIAQGMARSSGRAQVCFATSGPGATNLLTALADARLDSVPVVAITGQVPTALIGTDAFQEVDAVSIFRPVVKHAEQVRDAHSLLEALSRAFRIAESGRPGPVLLDIPKDVQQAKVELAPEQLAAAAELSSAEPLPAATPGIEAAVERVLELLAAAERPVLYIGGGVIHAAAHAELRELACRQELPVVSTLMGLGAFEAGHPLFCGMLGMHAAPYTNLLLHECDLLIALGARFDDRATGKLSEFCPAARTVHVDIDARELGKLRKVDVGVACDMREFLIRLNVRAPERQRCSWLQRMAELRETNPLPEPRSQGGRLHPLAIMRALGARIGADHTVTTDVGQHQMWAAQGLPIRRPRGLLTSGGLGSMGFGLPAAIGAAIETKRRVWCITGDGSLLINIQELATLAELALDVVIVLFDNRQLGMVRQQQQLFYAQRFYASEFVHPTDFVTVSRAFGITAYDWIPWERDLAELDSALAGPPGPRLIRVPLTAAELVLPMVPSGAGNHQMVGAQLAQGVDPLA
jgi:acetolactate synthase-1/2/3 large subunit